MNNSADSTPDTSSAPVIIAGAGLVGLMLACELGLAGVRTIVVDHATGPETGENRRGTMLHARGADLLDQRGLLERIFAEEEPAKWPMIHFANFWLDLSELLDREYSLIIPQVRTARVLEQRARELGADIRWEHKVIGVTQEADGVTAMVVTPDGVQFLTGRYLVGCDGENSAVRDLAGFTAEPGGTPWYGILADFEHLDAPWGSTLAPGGLLGITPHPYQEGWFRMMTVEFGITCPFGADEPVTAGELRESLRRISGQDWEIEAGTWMYRYAGSTRLATEYRRNRVFLAGEAAHVHYFGAGHSASTGLHDAANLGWKLAAEINGWAPPGLLDTYHAERHAVGQRITMAQQAQLALQYPLDRVASLRELFGELVKLPEVNRLLIGLVTDVRYPGGDGPVGDGDTSSLAGLPFPDVPLLTSSGETRAAGLLRAGRGLLLDMTGGSATSPGVADPWADRVDVVEVKPVAQIDAAVVLVRPDGHVAWTGPDGGDREPLRDALATWFGAPQAAL